MMEALDSWKEEKRSAYLYRSLAKAESNGVHKALFLELAEMAEKQAAIWAEKIVAAGVTVPVYSPDARARIVAALTSFLGPHVMRVALAALKVRGMSIYREKKLGPTSSTKPADIEHRHHSIKNGGNLRAAVFGVSDGLVSNASLIFGIAGASGNHSFILLSGIAGLLAGASSMGAGEYVSVRSQREMLEYQLALEKSELELYPEEEAAELAAIYRARGLPPADAKKLAHLLIQDSDKALETLAREELGINPNELGSPWGAAISSFVSFTLGAFIPVVPYVFSDSSFNLMISVGLTGVALFSVGAILSLFTQQNALWGGLRMLLIGATAGIVAYAIGHAVGITA